MANSVTEALAPNASSRTVASKLEGGCLGRVTLYAAFILVGTACGWLVVNCVYQFPANFTDVGNMFPGPSAIINGVTGLSISLLFTVYNIRYPAGLSRRAAQISVAFLCALSVVGQILLAGWWKVGRADLSFPVILIVFTMGNIVATLTYFVLFPLITVHYGGWLIAPIRAGTDFSGLVTALVGQAQAPNGGAGVHNFPISDMSAGFAALAAAGLVAWIIIMCTGLGLRKYGATLSFDAAESVVEQGDARLEISSFDIAAQSRCLRLKELFRGFMCPSSLVLPVALATLSQVNYWTLGANTYVVASQMLNAPGDCDGHFGSSALRFATTLNLALVPFGSVLSSLGTCPRPLFYCGFVFQTLCALALVLCCAGVGREAFWMTEAGRGIYIAAYGLVGMFEGYLLTMAYRYCGDDEGVPAELRDSASKLLSLLGVVAVNIPNIFMGVFLSNGTIACH